MGICLFGATVDLDRLRGNLPQAALLALVVLVAPFLSIPLSRDGRGPSVHVDAPFAFALVLAAERPALLLLAAGPMLGAYLLLRSESRAVLDRDEAERVEVDAAEPLTEAAALARAGVCGDRVRLRCDRSLPVRLAPDAVLQILDNLVDNACRYSPEERPVWLVGDRDEAEAVLAVEDDGAGVAPRTASA